MNLFENIYNHAIFGGCFSFSFSNGCGESGINRQSFFLTRTQVYGAVIIDLCTTLHHALTF